MYIIVAPIQIKEAFKDQYIKGMLENAQGSVNDEPGCLRFDVVQDAKPDLPFVTDTYNSGGESRSLQNTYSRRHAARLPRSLHYSLANRVTGEQPFDRK